MASKEDRLKVQGDTSKTLATKYRPRTFNEIVGQAHASSILKKSLLERSVPQQILFSGGSGLGKTTLARVLGASLLCQTPQSKRNDMNPCLKCQSCSFIFSSDGSHPDLIEFDAASFGGKDEIKEIASRAQLAPMLGPVKVYIIDEAHGLSNAGVRLSSSFWKSRLVMSYLYCARQTRRRCLKLIAVAALNSNCCILRRGR